MSILIFIFAQRVNIYVNNVIMKTIFIFILLSAKFLFGQTNSNQEEYLKEKGYVVTPNTKVEIPSSPSTSVYNYQNPNESGLTKKTNYVDDSNRVKDSLKSEALKLSYADKKRIEKESVERVLGGLKEEKYNLTEYENQETDASTQRLSKENNVLYLIIAILLIVIIFVIFKFRKSNEKD